MITFVKWWNNKFFCETFIKILTQHDGKNYVNSIDLIYPHRDHQPWLLLVVVVVCVCVVAGGVCCWWCALLLLVVVCVVAGTVVASACITRIASTCITRIAYYDATANIPNVLFLFLKHINSVDLRLENLFYLINNYVYIYFL